MGRNLRSPAVPPAALLKVDVISPNQTEAAALVAGKSADTRTLCKALLKAGAKNVALKLGACEAGVSFDSDLSYAGMRSWIDLVRDID